MAEWWMDERLVPTGELGGSVQDDTDFYQQLADLPLFETNGVGRRVRDAAARLAELADKETLREGLNIRDWDALHAYEDGLNHIALMARWFYGDPIYLERCMVSARNLERLTIRTEDGRRHFRDWRKMGHKDLAAPRAPARDGSACALMFHPALQYADYNRSDAALKLAREWADTWLKLMEPHRCPTEVNVLSGDVRKWGKDDWPLHIGYGSSSVYVWLYALTGDARYVEPYLRCFRDGVLPHPARPHLSELYALGALDNALPGDTLRKLAAQDAATTAYVAGDPTRLGKAPRGGARNWQATIDTIRDALRFPDMYTKAEQYTDRVFLGKLQTHGSRSHCPPTP